VPFPFGIASFCFKKDVVEILVQFDPGREALIENSFP